MDRNNSIPHLQMDLLAQKAIDIYGEITEDTAFYVREALLRLAIIGNPDIAICFTSSGGNCGAGFGIYDLLNNYPGYTAGNVFGFANSIASVILQACDIRRASENSMFYLHYPIQNAVTYEQRTDPDKRAEFFQKADESDKWFLETYLARVQISRDQMHQILKEERKLTARVALEIGLIDEIIKPIRKIKSPQGDE